MNRLEYLTQLRRSLEDGGLAEDEINDAMGFYEEIFLDAGTAHEAETAANLGSPEDLANKILQDSGIPPVPAHIFLIVGFKQFVFLKPFQHRIQGGF